MLIPYVPYVLWYIRTHSKYHWQFEAVDERNRWLTFCLGRWISGEMYWILNEGLSLRMKSYPVCIIGGMGWSTHWYLQEKKSPRVLNANYKAARQTDTWLQSFVVFKRTSNHLLIWENPIKDPVSFQGTFWEKHCLKSAALCARWLLVNFIWLKPQW